MRVDDLMEVMGAIAKLNRTIDGQEQMLNKYHELYGPLPMTGVPAEEVRDIIAPELAKENQTGS